jgi:outer membrane receptor protein involved in Fe transport
LPVTPKFKLAATGRYAWPMGPGRAHVQGGVSYQSSASSDIRQVSFACGGFLGSDMCADVNPNDFVDRIRSSTLVDLFTGYNWGNYSVELFAKNLFDKRNDVSRFVVCSICTQNKILAGRPRTIGIRAGIKF